MAAGSTYSDDQGLIRALRGLCKAAGQPWESSLLIHEADPYSSPPDDLVDRYPHNPGHREGKIYLFFGKTSFNENWSRKRTVGLAGVTGTKRWWKPEGKAKQLRGGGWALTLTYKDSMPLQQAGPHWKMLELSLLEPGGNQMLLWKIYRSNRTPTAGRLQRQLIDPMLVDPAEPGAAEDGSMGAEEYMYMPIRNGEEPAEEILIGAEELKFDDLEERDSAGSTVLKKIDGSSLASAKQIKEVADLILSGFPKERLVVVLSAVGSTADNIMRAAGTALSCGAARVYRISELAVVKDLHIRMAKELGLCISVVSDLLIQLEEALKGVARGKEITGATRHKLVSIGESMCAKLFVAHLNKRQKNGRYHLYDAFDIANDDFTNVVIKKLQGDLIDDETIPIVSGGDDLTATIISKALGLGEIQVWNAAHGVFTCDPNICEHAIRVPYLTFDEENELAYFGAQLLHPLSVLPDIEGNIPVRIKSSSHPQAPGTVISATRKMGKSILTCIASKSNMAILHLEKPKMLDQCDFLMKVLPILDTLGISSEFMGADESSIYLALEPLKLWITDLIKQKLNVDKEVVKGAKVHLLEHRSIILLMGDVEKSSLILQKALSALTQIDVNVQKVWQRASKNYWLVVDDRDVKKSVQALHSAFFESGLFQEAKGPSLPKKGIPIPVKLSGSKRKAAADHPEAGPSVRLERIDPISIEVDAAVSPAEEEMLAGVAVPLCAVPAEDVTVGSGMDSEKPVTDMLSEAAAAVAAEVITEDVGLPAETGLLSEAAAAAEVIAGAIGGNNIAELIRGDGHVGFSEAAATGNTEVEGSENLSAELNLHEPPAPAPGSDVDLPEGSTQDEIFAELEEIMASMPEGASPLRAVPDEARFRSGTDSEITLLREAAAAAVTAANAAFGGDDIAELVTAAGDGHIGLPVVAAEGSTEVEPCGNLIAELNLQEPPTPGSHYSLKEMLPHYGEDFTYEHLTWDSGGHDNPLFCMYNTSPCDDDIPIDFSFV